MVTVPKFWPNSTIVCMGTGPSLCAEDVEYCRGKARVIAINDAYRLAPWADVLYACDAKWWGWHHGVPEFSGLKYALTNGSGKWPHVQVLRNAGASGLELDPTGLRTGHNSGYQAINLAVHLGAIRIVLLGYDLQGDHFFGAHPDRTKPPFAQCLQSFRTLTEPLAAAGVSVINASRNTSLYVFPRQPLQQAVVEAAA